ncbi:MAG: phosphoribosyltransferase family protein [Kofleriaceae bacterium]
MAAPAARDRLLSLLRELAFEQREVVLSSGQVSNFYIDCRQVSLDAEGATLIGEVFFQQIRAVAPTALGVGGLTLGADPLATATSVHSHAAGAPLGAFLVRKEPKGHGTGRWVERGRRLAAGSPVVVVEDVVTTGASTLRAIERAEEDGLRVIHAIALVDRLEGGRAAIEARVPLTTVFTREDFLP